MQTPKYRRRLPHERETFTVPVNQPKGPRPGPEVLPWYWHPQREGVRSAPEAFQARLKEIDPDLRVVLSPVHERWMIWVKNPRIQHWLCKGWQLLMLWESPDTHAYLPLDDLIFANIYAISAEKTNTTAKAHFDKVLAAAKRNTDGKNKDFTNARQAQQDDFRKSLQISSAGRGNRFAMHHENQGPPSAGEAAWRAQTRKTRLSSDMLRQEQDEREKQHYGR